MQPSSWIPLARRVLQASKRVPDALGVNRCQSSESTNISTFPTPSHMKHKLCSLHYLYSSLPLPASHPPHRQRPSINEITHLRRHLKCRCVQAYGYLQHLVGPRMLSWMRCGRPLRLQASILIEVVCDEKGASFLYVIAVCVF